MLSLRGEERAELKDTGADQRRGGSRAQTAGQQPGENAAQKDMRDELQLQKIQQLAPARQIAQQYGDRGGRVEELSRQLRVDRPTAVGERVP